MLRTLVLIAVIANVFLIATSQAVCKNPFEVYDACPPPCPQQICGVDERVILCQKPPQSGDPDCEPGCHCIDGYVRNDKGVCIPRDQCPNQEPVKDQCTGPYEEYVECPDCSQQTCDTIGKVYHCPLMTADNCKPACRCKPDYYRNAINECISEEQCLKCTKEHEFFSCGPACDNVCATLDTQNRTNCPIINVKCNEMCYCEDSYARDCNKDCVPVNQCKAHTCGTNEVVSTCVNGGCVKRNCTQINDARICINPVKCETGCICSDGYLRDENGICIPQDQCPQASCHDDPNTVPGCSNYCGKSCTDYNMGPKACTLICLVDGCDCKKGYVYDASIKKCVLPEDCPTTTTAPDLDFHD